MLLTLVISRMRDQYIRTGQGFLLVYAVTRRMSFKSMKEYKQQVLQVKESYSYPMVLIGNQKDLEDQREVTTEEGKDLSKELNCAFFETSAKTRTNVEEAFEHLVREMLRIDKTGQQQGADLLERPKGKRKRKCVIC